MSGRFALRQGPSTHRHPGCPLRPCPHRQGCARDRCPEAARVQIKNEAPATPDANASSPASSHSSNSFYRPSGVGKHNPLFTCIESALEAWGRCRRARIICTTLLLAASVSVIISALVLTTRHRPVDLRSDGRDGSAGGARRVNMTNSSMMRNETTILPGPDWQGPAFRVVQ